MRRTLLTFCALIGPAMTTPAFSDDWTQWLGPNRNGIVDKPWKGQWSVAGPKVLWKADVGLGYSSVTVANGRAYTMGYVGNGETVFCFNAVSGKPIWSHAYPASKMAKFHKGGPNASVVIHDGRVVSVGKDGQVFAFEEGDEKKVLWNKNMKDLVGVKHEIWGYACSPLCVDGNLVFHAGATAAIDPKTGKVLWRSDKSYKAGYSTPTPFTHRGKTLLACLNAHGVVVQDAATGKEIAAHPFKEKSYGVNAVTPIVAGKNNDHIFVSCGYDGHAALFRFDGRALQEVWDTKQMKNHMNNCVLVDGHLYGFDGNAGRRNARFACLRLSDGKLIWEKSGLGAGALIASGNTLIILSEKGKLVIADASPDGFKERASARVFGGTCWVHPTLAHGRLYCRNNEGKVVCLDVSGK